MVTLALDPRRSLFAKYCVVLFAAVALPLFASGGLEAWLGYRDRRDQLHALLGLEARDAAFRIEGFIDTIRTQLGWMVQLPWTPPAEERQRLDALRLLRQVPAVAQLTLVDGDGRERLQVSRVSLNRAGSGVDRSADPAVAGARMAQSRTAESRLAESTTARAWYGPVIDHRGSEPFMTVAVAGNRASVGVAVAEVNLKLIRDVVSGIRVGETGQAFVLDGPGRLIAHPDLSLVLRGADDPAARALAALRAVVRAAGGAATGVDAAGRGVIAAAATIPGLDWTVVVMQPAAEAFGPIVRALLRTGALILLGLLLAGALAYGLARRMTGPIRLLEHGTQRIGAGDFAHRIAIASADELGRLAARFNAMAGELALSQERQERIARLRRFLAPQVAELVDRCGDDGVLDGRRLEVAVIFGDLRGFTAFSAGSPPEVVIAVLGEYFAALGNAITAHGATLVTFTGDGLMALVNAPVPTPDPGPTAVRLALAMQEAVRPLADGWDAEGFRLGFGVGAAMGPATVGRIGYEGRSDYTAIGPAVNLAARLCAAAADAQILIDISLAEAVRGRCAVTALGTLPLKGLADEVPVFGIAREP
ncbi:cache domain-containing protein [Methylobacterium nonmethylotrophicum]|uniref:HAMP domain-containing protein n=1 Tax=Methylobacterium nonmethylotrophicum TaxID=1141884 RepID=A0A4Z0NX46_9HYPH|nr:adenylate/guanylate cyclase domain-containing protein [Methylobacterium nonmethylotrophicum]TGE02235.1 HAMP domain-containing protein [Methylobacterium nonmethylotrophicum]